MRTKTERNVRCSMKCARSIERMKGFMASLTLEVIPRFVIQICNRNTFNYINWDIAR